MLKVIQPAAAAFNPAAREIEHPIYWKREVLAYQSGLLEDLPAGIVAGRCFAIEERGEELCWLWLEEVQDHAAARWSLLQYHQAEAIGRFNGAYLTGWPLPTYRWLGPAGPYAVPSKPSPLYRSGQRANAMAAPLVAYGLYPARCRAVAPPLSRAHALTRWA